MKVGIIGIGGICRKAYLPVITSRDDIDIILCSRNKDVLLDMSRKYRIKEFTTCVEELIKIGIDCAFVHSSTESHYEICEKLLKSGIHVYVDKPISYSLDDALKLADIAKKNGKILMTGFNRRYAPMVADLKTLGKPHIIIIEKNRVNLPGTPRVFVFDDFIHVVDTLRFLMGDDYKTLTVDSLKDESGLKNVVIKLSNKFTTAIGIMNRDNGIREETMEYMSSGKKAIVSNLTETSYFENNTASTKKFGDWDNTLTKRGFTYIIEDFLKRVRENNLSYDILEDSIKTHKLCDDILKQL